MKNILQALGINGDFVATPEAALAWSHREPLLIQVDSLFISPFFTINIYRWTHIANTPTTPVLLLHSLTPHPHPRRFRDMSLMSFALRRYAALFTRASLLQYVPDLFGYWIMHDYFLDDHHFRRWIAFLSSCPNSTVQVLLGCGFQNHLHLAWSLRLIFWSWSYLPHTMI